MAQRHSIPHLKPLIVDVMNPEGQGCGNIRSLPRPLLLKSEFSSKSVFLPFLVVSKFDENQN